MHLSYLFYARYSLVFFFIFFAKHKGKHTNIAVGSWRRKMFNGFSYATPLWTHVTHYESIFVETHIKQGRYEKVFMLYQNIKGDLHKHFCLLSHSAVILEMENLFDPVNCWNNFKLKYYSWGKIAICFTSIMLWSFFIFTSLHGC